MLARTVGLNLMILILSFVAYKFYQIQSYPSILILLEPPIYQSSNQWGSLRSGHYFGLKRAQPFSLVAGLMWYHNEIRHNSLPIRDQCNQFDRLSRYSWQKHDFRRFGIQQIVDQDLKITTEFILNQPDEDSWLSKIKFVPENGSFVKPVSVIFYFATESPQDMIQLESNHIEQTGNAIISGRNNGVDFRATISYNVDDSNVIFVNQQAGNSDPPLIDIKNVFLKNLHVLEMRNGDEIGHVFGLKDVEQQQPIPEGKNINFVALQLIVTKAFELRVSFHGGDHSFMNDDDDVFATFDRRLAALSDSFDQKFEGNFHLTAKNFSDEQVAFAKAALSNMLGGIAYFQGSAVVQNDKLERPVRTAAMQLLTAVPSRSFFPRGFLWDEGFHQLLVSRFDPQLSSQILRSWLSLLNIDGWIPREVILGYEAEQRVPAEFLIQRDTNANPPTLFLALEKMVDTKKLNKETLKALYPKLRVWYNWLNVSQVGSKAGTYRWRGRDEKSLGELNVKTLTSGLDDYPRPSSPSSDEIHIDLRCWMALASRVMAKISRSLEAVDEKFYQATADYLSDNQFLDTLHWSEKYQMYCDFGRNSLKVRLVRKQESEQMIRKEIEPVSFDCVPEFGYVSLFPMLMKILEPNSPKLGFLLDKIRDEKVLWTNFGVRSLAKSSRYYQKHNTPHDPPYWRGAIWINMNYLVLKSLHEFSHVDGPYREKAGKIYRELRLNLIRNVFKEYQKTGYIWEQYDDSTGQGKGSHPFTGWSALIVLIMAEDY